MSTSYKLPTFYFSCFESLIFSFFTINGTEQSGVANLNYITLLWFKLADL